MDVIFYTIWAVFVIWMLIRQFAPIRGVRNVTAKQLQDECNGSIKFIDVREVHEYKRGHIHGAINIPLSQFSQRLGEISKDQQVLLYCQSGMRSKQAAKLLRRNGYTNVANLQGGISAWSGPTQ